MRWMSLSEMNEWKDEWMDGGWMSRSRIIYGVLLIKQVWETTTEV